MLIKTESIIDLLEIELNKKISDIKTEDLKDITYLRISKTGIDDVLYVDSSDLQYFNNLKEVSIENCMIDNDFIENLKLLKNIDKISFIHCDFIDDYQGYFDQLSHYDLLLNDVIGLNNAFFSDISNLTIVNSYFTCFVGDIEVLDISRSNDININFSNSHIKKLIINETQYDKYKYFKSNIIIKDKYDEVIKEISND